LDQSIWLVISAVAGASIGAAAVLAAQIVSSAEARKRFKVEVFERFRRESSEDRELRRISTKREPLTDEEVDEYIGFFEEIGL